MHANMRKRLLLLPITVCFVFAPIAASARETPAPVASSGIEQNVQPLDPAAATQAWLASVPRDQREKSDAYFEAGYWLILWNFLLVAAISIFLLASRISARLRDFSQRLTKFKTLQVACYALPYLVILYILSFPLNLYEHFFREHQYGFATQTFLAWFREQLIGLGVTIVAATILLIVLYAVFQRAPRTWWIWGTVVAIIFSFVLVFIAPVFIEPLFNTYKPLMKPEIRDPILAMARANQIPVKQVFEVDASRQTTRVSANVAGVLGTTRIALNDNLLRQCTLPEIREVMAHEMGHYVLNHGAKLLTYFGIFILVGFALTRALFDAAVRRWGDKWGVRGIAERAAFRRHALPQHRRTRHRTRGRCFRRQHFARAGRHGESGSKTRRLSQTRSDAAGRIHLFRSSQRPCPDSYGHGLESGKSAGWPIIRIGKLFDISISG